jgi:carbonic anhydrase
VDIRIEINPYQHMTREDTPMTTTRNSRRSFLKGAGSSLIAVGAVAGLGLSANPAGAAQSCATQSRKSQKAMTSEMALQMLKEGNARFVQGKMLRCDYMQQVRATGDGQFPFAAIVGCIDSRASNELIFDQGIGDIFSARVAGNFVNDDILGSLEFACAAAGAKLIVVVGHTECGAVKGACDDVVLGNLTQTLANLKPAVAAVPGYESDRTSSNPAFVQAVADKNVGLTIERIRTRSSILTGMVDRGELGLAGAMYDVHKGLVNFM